MPATQKMERQVEKDITKERRRASNRNTNRGFLRKIEAPNIKENERTVTNSLESRCKRESK